eukprot:1156825-Pelagomonas_calceolata.AAC.1
MMHITASKPGVCHSLIEKSCRQREHSLHHSRKRRQIGSNSRESPPPEGRRQASVGQVGFWKHAAPGDQIYIECF